MHLVIATREDPHLPLARLRARGQLTELRAADLRFTPAEAAEFLGQVMGLNLSAEDIAALEVRTEGWIAGLQLAAISMQGHKDTTNFIKSFTGSHHFVLDYLLEEVLEQQPESVQTFLLRTSILDRLCSPLCDAVLLDSSASGQGYFIFISLAHFHGVFSFLHGCHNEARADSIDTNRRRQFQRHRTRQLDHTCLGCIVISIIVITCEAIRRTHVDDHTAVTGQHRGLLCNIKHTAEIDSHNTALCLRSDLLVALQTPLNHFFTNF
jgi:hypothetical protein